MRTPSTRPSPAYDILRPIKKLEPDFFHLLFRTKLYLDLFKSRSRGIMDMRLRLYFDQLGQIPLICPPHEEQVAIVRFLDHADRLIRRYIRAKKKLIALLNEQKQAIIHQAVTRGLDPNAKLKPSGVPWLGDVPRDWVVSPVCSRFEVQLGKMLDSKKITRHHLRPYLRVADVQWGAINVKDLPQMDFEEVSRERFRLIPGDLLINEGGSYPGRTAIWNGELAECYYQKALHRLRPALPARDNSEFFYFVMFWAAHRGVFVHGGNETTIEHLPAVKLRKYRFAFPSRSEQNKIVEHLNNRSCAIDRIVAQEDNCIRLLQEYRTRLIADVVTG